jgi:hypothetical protein
MSIFAIRSPTRYVSTSTSSILSITASPEAPAHDAAITSPAASPAAAAKSGVYSARRWRGSNHDT